jgi:hypothetical protein
MRVLQITTILRENPKLQEAADQMKRSGVKVSEAVAEALKQVEESAFLRGVSFFHIIERPWSICSGGLVRREGGRAARKQLLSPSTLNQSAYALPLALAFDLVAQQDPRRRVFIGSRRYRPRPNP